VDWDENPEEVFVTEMESHRLRELVVRIHITRMDIYANVRRITAAHRDTGKRSVKGDIMESIVMTRWRYHFINIPGRYFGQNWGVPIGGLVRFINWK
jgi:hypothetical protein